MHRHVGPSKWHAVQLNYALCTCFLCVQKNKTKTKTKKQQQKNKQTNKQKNPKYLIKKICPNMHQITLRSKHKTRKKKEVEC